MQRAKPEPFTKEQLQGVNEIRQRLAHILPPTFNTDFFLARWHRAYNGDVKEIERCLGELIAHRQVLGYDCDDVVKFANEVDCTSKTFERFAISHLKMDVFSDDVVVFLQKMKSVDIKEIMKVIPLGHVLHSYFLLQECFHRAMHAHETRTGRPSAAVVIIDLSGLVITDFLNPLSAPSKLARFVVKIWSEYFSENLIRLYLINPPAILSIMWQITKQIVDSKTQSRIVFVPHVEELQELLAKEAIPVEFGGTRVDTSGFADPPESAISKPKLVRPEEYFIENEFWKKFGIEKIPQLKVATVKSKVFHTVDIECKAGQTLVWLFSTNSEITFEVVHVGESKVETSVWPKISLTTLKVPETGHIKCQRDGTYQARFSSVASVWLIASKVSYKFSAV